MGTHSRRGRYTIAISCALTIILTGSVSTAAAGQSADLTLIEAIRSDVAPAAIGQLLNDGVNPNQGQPDGTTALHWAAHKNAASTVSLLLDAGADVNASNRYGVTPLTLAAANGSSPIVALLLASGALPNATPGGGDTPLMIAARTGRVDVIQQLLDAGADIDATETWKGQTALMWAAAEGHGDAITTLVSAGASLKARSNGHMNPLLFAVREGHADAVRTLTAFGADIDAAAGDGTTPLDLAVINAHFELADLLIDLGADPNLTGPRGSVLHALAWIRRPGSGRPPLPTGALDSLDLAQSLLEAGANPNNEIGWREIPFEVDLGIVKPPPGISVGRNFLSFVGATPFYLAAKHGDVELMRLLVEHGADPQTPTDQHITPLMAAAGVGFWDGESPGPLNGTSEQVRLEAVQLTVELGNDIHAVTDFGNTRLEGEGHELLLRHPLNLSEFDAQRDRGDMRWDGSTALHGAAMMGSNLIVRYLLDLGANIDVENTLGWTPLMVAEGVFVANTEKAWPDTVQMLQELGASSN